jgi:hypothetical protein
MHHIITRIKGILLAGTLSLLVSSCEQIIKVTLRDQQPNVVIEGFVTNGAGPFIIRLSESQAYFDQSDFKGIENALVQIDNSLVTETLIDKGSGIYTTSRKLRGTVGYPFKLNVTVMGRIFSAQVILPLPVRIDTAYFAPSVFDKDSLNVIIQFNDPIFDENYYRIKLFRNGWSPANEYNLITDASSDGQRLLVPFYYREFAPGDTVIVEMDNVERSTWLYFKGLSEIVHEGFNAKAPGNPPTNISGGALGYFGAWSVTKYKVIIPKGQ